MDALAAEWVKLRSVRSTAYVVGVVGVFTGLCLVWSWQASRYWDGLSLTRKATADAAPPETPLAIALPVCAIVLGALVITGEHATGMIRTSLVSSPRRGALFVAKAVAVGLGAALATGASLVGAILGGRIVVADRPIPSFDEPLDDHVPHLLALGASMVVIALLAFAVGTIVKSTAGTVGSLAGVLFVVPPMANLVPDPWGDRLAAVLPGGLAEQVAASPGATPPQVFAAPMAAVLLAGYVVVALGVAFSVFVRRDA
ncbi:ABC transporter permease subunit [Spirillospora sp. CA-294931]|uniref:ABC transporter permease subunit n=1 Tax=Spirillospora sp. CA-294931 TaxID=3240042 RepID=UPI003D89E047